MAIQGNAARKAITVTVLLFATALLFGLPACKHQEDCGAYQGSGKSTRSFKSKKHHSEVIVSLPAKRA
jgi:hypothetical protein